MTLRASTPTRQGDLFHPTRWYEAPWAAARPWGALALYQAPDCDPCPSNSNTRDVRVAEGPSYRGVRSVVWEVKGELTMLLTNLDVAPRRLFDFYNKRQTIEAFFKASKHVFGMANLRSRRFLAIAVFLGFVLLTHYLLVWTKAALFAGTRLVAAHTRWIVEKIISVPASLVRRLELPAAGRTRQGVTRSTLPRGSPASIAL